MYQASSLISF